jgi:hypothetical protein
MKGNHERGGGQCLDWLNNGAECPCSEFVEPYRMDAYTCGSCGHAQSFHPSKIGPTGVKYTWCTHDRPGSTPCTCSGFVMQRVSETYSAGTYAAEHYSFGSNVGTSTTYNVSPPIDKRSCTSCPHWVSAHTASGCGSRFCKCVQTPRTIELNRAAIDNTPLGRMCLNCRHPDLSHDGSGCQQFDSHAPCECPEYRPTKST